MIVGLCPAGPTAFAGADPGDTDQSFGRNGTVTVTAHPKEETVLRDMIRLPGGKLLASGGGTVDEYGVLVQLLPDGTLDPDFGGGDGIVSTPDALWAKLELQGERIIAFGRVDDRSTVARFQADGTLDPDFGIDGTFTPDILADFPKGNESVEFNGAGIDDEGRILPAVAPGACAAEASNPDGDWDGGSRCPNAVMYRLSPDGKPDLTFGNGTGRILMRAGRWNLDRPAKFALAADDRPLVRSTTTVNSSNGPAYGADILQKFDLSGKVDTSFGEKKGIAVVGGDSGFDGVHPGEILVTKDGSITVIAGGLNRFTAEGKRIRPGFPYDVFRESGVGNPELNGGTVDRKGRLHVSGTTGLKGKVRKAFAVRLSKSGEPDAVWGENGLAKWAIGGAMTSKQVRRRIGADSAPSVLGPDGSITVATTARVNDRLHFVFHRFEGGEGRYQSCKGRRATVQGTPGDDTLRSGSDSVVVSGGGDDTIIGGTGSLICTGPGDDVLRIHATADRKDRIFTGTGDDRVTVDGANVWTGSGDDRVSTGRWSSRIKAGSGNDTVLSDGSDKIWGESGKDVIRAKSDVGASFFGGSGRDRLTGSESRDRLDGGTGSDRIAGGKGLDHLYGRSGSDSLFGGPGFDTLIGGPGPDVLDAGPAGPDYDIYGVHDRRARGKVKIIGNRVKATSLQVWMKCSGYTSHPVKSGFDYAWMFDELNFRPSGKFREDVDYYDGFGQNVDGWMKGRRTSGRIVVRYALEDDFSYGEDGSYHCQVGNPYGIKGRRHGVKIVLERRPDQKQTVIQGGR